MAYLSVIPVLDANNVKATTSFPGQYPYLAADSAQPLTGGVDGVCWTIDYPGVTSDQRFHVAFSTGHVVKRIYYENLHRSGTQTDQGAKNFTFWGSNDINAFNELTYSIDTGWTQIGGALQFAEHVGSDVADPRYIVVPNTVSYKYYAVKIADCWGGAMFGLRRLLLQELTNSILMNGTLSVDTEYGGAFYAKENAIDGIIALDAGFWATASAVEPPHWLKYDLGVGVSKVVTLLRINEYGSDSGGTLLQDFKLQGSNDDSNWDDLLTSSGHASTPDPLTPTNIWYEWNVPNGTAYRYYRVYTFTARSGGLSGFREVEMRESTHRTVSPMITSFNN